MSNVNMFSSNWYRKFEQFIEYLNEHNGVYPLSNEIYNNFKIGNWVSTQRKIYNNGIKQKDGSIRYNSYILSKDRIDLLNSCNFVWQDYYNSRKKYSDMWQYKFKLLVEYLNEYNKYPKFFEKYKCVNLGTWVNTQRVIFKNGDVKEDGSIVYNFNTLTKQNIEMLNSINFEWINNEQSYNEEIITKDNYNKKIILLNLKLEKLLLMSKNKIDSKNDIDKLNDNFKKILSK